MFGLYDIVFPSVTAFFHLFSRWQVNGRENVPGEGPLIVVANHTTMFDPPLLTVSLRRQVAYMTKEELFRRRAVASFISRLGAFPVRRGKMDRTTLRAAEDVLAAGNALGLFPEGSRSEGGQLQKANVGPVVIAQRCRAPLLPVGIIGTRVLAGRAGLLRRPRITVNIGRPFSLDGASGKLSRVENIRCVMARIAELLPPEYRGVYGTEVPSGSELPPDTEVADTEVSA